MLNKVPELRITNGSHNSLKNNEWFDNFDWVISFSNNIIKESIILKEVKPPFIPSKECLITEDFIKMKE